MHEVRELLCNDLQANHCHEMRIGGLGLPYMSISSVKGYKNRAYKRCALGRISVFAPVWKEGRKGRNQAKGACILKAAVLSPALEFSAGAALLRLVCRNLRPALSTNRRFTGTLLKRFTKLSLKSLPKGGAFTVHDWVFAKKGR